MPSEELYPLKFEEIFKDKIWGGENLKRLLGKNLPEDARIGESWEISDRSSDISVIANGPLAGKSLREVLKFHKEEVLGRKDFPPWSLARFPLLIKFIDAQDDLSVQVHPNDQAAQRFQEADPGKTEAWVIIDAEPGARLIRGLKEGTGREDFERSIKENRVEECLNWVEVAPGDCIFLPPGTVHALCRGLVLAEIQQNSDLTYRIWDWGRVGFDGKPRPLHINKALEVIDFSLTGPPKSAPKPLEQGPGKRKCLVECDKFILEHWEFEPGEYRYHMPGSFLILMAIAGTGEILYNQNDAERIKKGQTVLIPASIKDFALRCGEPLEFIVSYLPQG
ncbi:MAG: hypothetical protein AMS15_05475 [Planctomycetes bacterium DG_23]|nr:MAG: hypothetical protein AMS15_05475 [Planctomycetes bacterium DG_23]